ncbi:right-handed parallel beta-helix repeat-containing protein [Geodermatophilus sp. SYSU D00965]
MSRRTLPGLFIGSSSEGKGLAEELAAELSASGRVRVLPWYEAFDIGFAALEDLARRIEEVDFAAFLLLPDDRVDHRADSHPVPRDNVVFELGLFMGRLNRERTFALVEHDPQSGSTIRLPSDLRGVTTVWFQREGVAEAARTIARRVRALGPAARVPRGAHIVESGVEGRNIHDSISSAVRAACPGDVVLVRPGMYAEQVVLTKPLSILGVGVVEQQRAVLRAAGPCTLSYRAAGGTGRVSALTVEGGGPAQGASIDVLTGTLVVDGCDVMTRGPVEAAIRVRGDGQARITGNRITDGSGIGVLVCERGHAHVAHNLITGHAHSCVEVRDGCRPELSDNRIGLGLGGGVLVRGPGTRPRIEHNDISGNRDAGVAITEQAQPVLRGNRIHDGYGPGLWVGDGGGGTVSDNDLYGNRGTAVEIAGGGRPLLVDNRIHNGTAGGVLVAAGGSGRIEHNEIRNNERAGVALLRGARPETFTRNRIVDGRAEGVYDETSADRDDNDVHRNARGDWRTPDDPR